MIEIQITTSGSITVMAPTGDLTSDLGMQLMSAVADLVQKGHKNIVLDLSGVRHINSSGIGSLVSAFTKVSNSGGRIVLTGLGKTTRDLLSVTKLMTVFEATDSLDDAMTLLSSTP
jgi:anti-sigma B factor antagonist